MLTPKQIDALRDATMQLADPLTEYLLADIARRVANAGQLTSTAAYQVWRAQQLGMSQREIKKKLKEILKVSDSDIKKLVTQSAKTGYNFDIKNLPTASAVPFANNLPVQQMVDAAVKLAQDDFTNLTQTLGMVDPYGNALPLQDAYRKTMDYAFEQVFTGASDYNTAVRQATANLAKYGLRTINYESGVHTSIEAATRRNIMGGIGLMSEQISQYNHDELGANGWEISAHAAPAPDHAPIQGQQYSDADYKALNDSLVRRIGTLNCGHVAFPIILGVSRPQYTPEQLQKFKEDNEKGVTYQGRHYTMYEATQKQRQIESAIRTQKRRILIDDEAGDSDKLLTDRIRLTRLKDEYNRFSKAADLPTQQERAQVVGFGNSQAAQANEEANGYYTQWSKSIGANNSIKTLADYYDLKYNNPPEYELLQRYARDVESGWISPNASFDNYSTLYHRIESEVVGSRTSNGLLITGQSEHFMQRVLGTAADPKTGLLRSGVTIEDIQDALANGIPRSIRESVKEDGSILRSQKFVSADCDVTVNPDTGKLIQCNPA